MLSGPSKKLGLLSRIPHRFLNRRLRKLTLSPTFRHTSHRVQFLFYGIGLVCLMLLTVFPFSSQFYASFRACLLDGSAPVLYVLNKPFERLRSFSVDVENFFALSANIKSLQSLEQERDFWKSRAFMLRRENEELKKALPLIHQKASHFLRFPIVKKMTQVIARPSSLYGRHIIIEGGEDQGFLKDDTIVQSKGLVGRLREVGKRVSRVLLITDMDSRIPVLLGSSKHVAVLAGDNSPFPKLIRLQEDMMKPNPEIGEIVFTSGEGGIFQPGIPIGIIQAYSENLYRIQPFVDFDDVELVGILPSYEPFLEGLEGDAHGD